MVVTGGFFAMSSTTHFGAMAPAREHENSAVIEKGLQGMLSGLSLQFVLGLALATVATYDSDTHVGNRALYQLFLLLHILVGLGLLVGSTALIVTARTRAPKLTGRAVVGLCAILVSVVTGLARMSINGEWLTFLMGAGFIVAISLYGQMLVEILRHGDSTG
jgi:hypothetical protein